MRAVIPPRRWGAWVLLLFLGLLVGGCEVLGFPEWQWRQKLTVEVESPSGLRSAGSVMEVTCGSSPEWLRGIGGGGLGCELQGEAVSLEIASGQVLFALLTGAPGSQNYPKKVAYHVFFPDRTLTTVEERGDRLEREFRGKVRELPRENYPLLVTFADINDPTTVKEVDPDNLAATFGPGVSLKQITLEISDEPVTEGRVEGVLQWLTTVGDGMLDGRKISTITAEYRLANDLSRLDFKRIGD